MPQVNVTTSQVVPSFYNFLEMRSESLGISWYEKGGKKTSYKVLDPADRSADPLGRFTVVRNDADTTVYLTVEMPSSNLPDWMDNLIHKYEAAVASWLNHENPNPPRINIKYVFG